MRVIPNTAEAIDAPPAHVAYANTDLRREMHQVLALERDGRRVRTVTGPPVDATAAERAWLLRRAALMDRMALDSPGPGRTAPPHRPPNKLVLYDRRPGGRPAPPRCDHARPRPPPLRASGVRRMDGRRAPRHVPGGAARARPPVPGEVSLRHRSGSPATPSATENPPACFRPDTPTARMDVRRPQAAGSGGSPRRRRGRAAAVCRACAVRPGKGCRGAKAE